jgi:ADP-ribose pyrophosphatase YjhB (NUDIX family)
MTTTTGRPHDLHPTPTAITDWPARQATATIPYQVIDGHPINPVEQTGRTGRNLDLWGENPAADPIVIAGHGPTRKALLIRRSDCGHWAIPGGMVDPGETAPAALVRELREETGVDLRHTPAQVIARTYVADPRNTDWAWITTTAAIFQLPAEVTAVGADDALDARWWPFPGVAVLESAIRAAGGCMYEAHRPLLTTAAGWLDN